METTISQLSDFFGGGFEAASKHRLGPRMFLPKGLSNGEGLITHSEMVFLGPEKYNSRGFVILSRVASSMLEVAT